MKGLKAATPHPDRVRRLFYLGSEDTRLSACGRE
jgi:hypothetical protein